MIPGKFHEQYHTFSEPWPTPYKNSRLQAVDTKPVNCDLFQEINKMKAEGKDISIPFIILLAYSTS
jgi:hypothetical protein